MKNQIKTLFASLILIFASFSVNAQDRIITENKLPKEIKTYIKKHFPNNTIIQASIDKDLMSKSYDVILKENIKLEFDSKNRIKEIEGNSKLPKSVIPNQILKYVQINYPKNFITDWELDNNNQKVELENGISLEFNMKGEFLRVDD
ncbi:MAG: PepSY-like domain-containing protein [Flavobacteriales bacterium]|nr:PepSY-like domain-containing protein [Flavobacteriales bacterium]